METIRGKASRDIGFSEFRKRLTGYDPILLDLGTGDGRYVHALAMQRPGCFVIGLDACRENLREGSRTDRPNVLFVIAEAHKPPHELRGLISHLTINFPWGSLLDGLLSADPAMMEALIFMAGANASIEIRLNAGALEEAGSAFDRGVDRVSSNLLRSGWSIDQVHATEPAELRALPTTWARRLAFGPDPWARLVRGRLVDRE